MGVPAWAGRVTRRLGWFDLWSHCPRPVVDICSLKRPRANGHLPWPRTLGAHAQIGRAAWSR
jgi:hypothetical protein